MNYKYVCSKCGMQLNHDHTYCTACGLKGGLKKHPFEEWLKRKDPKRHDEFRQRLLTSKPAHECDQSKCIGPCLHKRSF